MFWDDAMWSHLDPIKLVNELLSDSDDDDTVSTVSLSSYDSGSVCSSSASSLTTDTTKLAPNTTNLSPLTTVQAEVLLQLLAAGVPLSPEQSALLSCVVQPAEANLGLGLGLEVNVDAFYRGEKYPMQPVEWNKVFAAMFGVKKLTNIRVSDSNLSSRTVVLQYSGKSLSPGKRCYTCRCTAKKVSVEVTFKTTTLTSATTTMGAISTTPVETHNLGNLGLY